MVELHEIQPEPIKPPKDEKKTPVRPHRFFGIVQKIQKYSSFAFLGFMGLHVGSVVFSAAISPEIGEQALQFTRPLYQTPLTENLLVYGSLGAHVLSGLTLRLHKLYLSKIHYGQFKMPKLNPISLSGLLLIPVVLGHIWSSRIAPQLALGDSSLISLQFMSYNVRDHPIKSWIAFSLLTGFAFFHVLFGTKKWLNLYGGKYKSRTLTTFVACFAVSLISIFKISRMPIATGWLAEQFHLAMERSNRLI